MPLDTYLRPAEPGVFASEEVPQPEPYTKFTYKIGVNDKLEISIAEHPEFSGPSKVNSDGTIELKTLDERIYLAGLTPPQAEARIWDVIMPYVVGKPRVKVDVAQSRSRFFIALGAVGRVGRYFIGLEDVTVRDALFAANLFSPGANKDKIFIITPDERRKPSYVEVDAKSVLMGDLRQNVVLRPGDIVYVPTTVYFKINAVLDEIIGQTSKVQNIEGDITYGRAIPREGFGTLPPSP
jgi:protein involved in polysaccharide export with SLBB domain